jgi:hypothetical protein
MRITRLFAASVALAMTLAGSSVLAQVHAANPPLGLVTKALKAHVGNTELSDGSTVYTGDYISTDDGGDASMRIGTASLELLGSSAAHVYYAPYGAVVELNRGTAVYTTLGGHDNLVIVASDVRATPVVSLADFGRVSLDDPCNVTVASQRGQVEVKVGSESRLVEEGKAYRVRVENAVTYRKYLSPDASDYHDYHEHRPCAAADMAKGRPPIAPGQSHFLLVALGVTGAATGFLIYKAMESPARP